MSETDTNQIKNEAQQNELPKDTPEPKAFKPKPDELVRIAGKQLFYQRISACCMVVIALCVLFAVLKVVPMVETTLAHINDTAIKAQESLVQVDEMTDGLNEASKNLNKLVDENVEVVTDAVKSISEIDFEGLNQAITDLQGAVGPLANFFGKFK